LGQATYLTPADQDLSVWPPKIVDAGKKIGTDSLKSKIEEHSFKIKTCYWQVKSIFKKIYTNCNFFKLLIYFLLASAQIMIFW
jgi:hypothetical protein